MTERAAGVVGFGLGMVISSLVAPALGVEGRRPFVRLAEREIDPAQLENFKAAIKEAIFSRAG